MIKNLTILSVVMLLCISYSHAQGVKDNAGVANTEQGKPVSKGLSGGDIINVDPYTGTGSVRIPLYEYSIDGVPSNISLNYLARGIRVDERSSSVGLGWNLEAGGVIVRQTNGLEDEVTLPVKFMTDTNDYLQGNLAPNATLDQSVQNTDDLEADLFHASFCGRNFSFVIRKNGSAYECITNTNGKISIGVELYSWDPVTGIESSQNMASQYISPDSNHNLFRFYVTDEFGNRYIFERGDYQYKEYELSLDHFKYPKGIYYPTNTWNLTRVITFRGQEIGYTYYRKYVAYEESHTEVLYPDQPLLYQPDPGLNQPDTVIWDNLQVKDNVWRGIKTHIASISYPNGVFVDFQMHPSSKRCDCESDYFLWQVNITGRSAQYQQSISFEMQQAHFVTPAFGNTAIESSTPADCGSLVSGFNYGSLDINWAKNRYLTRGYRPKLKGIKRKINGSGTSLSIYEPYYTFDYNSTPLPFRFAPQKDFYGYYNNGANTPYQRVHPTTYATEVYDLSIPNHQNQPFGQDRSYNFNYAKAFVLNKVTNRTGGEIVINYDDVSYINPTGAYRLYEPIQGPGGGFTVDTNANAELEGTTVKDGLIVGSIVYNNLYNNMNPSFPHRKTVYSYSNGQRFNQGGFTWYRNKGGSRVLTNFFVNSMDYINGANHGFSNVTVTEYGYNNELLSAVKYEFSNLTYVDGYGTPQTNMISHMGDYRHLLPCILDKHRMGLPLKIEHYDELMAKRSQTEHSFEYVTYPDFIENTTFFPSTWYNDITNTNSASTGSFTYNIISNKVAQLTGKTDRTFIGNSGTQINSGISCYYDSKGNLSKTMWFDSKGNTLFRKLLKRAYDYPAIGGNSTSFVNTSHHILSEEIWSGSGSDSALVSMNFSAPALRGTYWSTPAKFMVKSLDPLPAATANNNTYINRNNALDFNNNTSYGTYLFKTWQGTKFDSRGNAIQEEIGEGKVIGSYVYDTWNGNKLAEVSNARYDDIAYTSFEGGTNGYLLNGLTDYSRGNWNFPGSAVQYSDDAMTGKFVLPLIGYGSTLTSNALSNKKYLLTFWEKSVCIDMPGTPDPMLYKPTVNILGSNNLIKSTVTCTVSNTVGQWRLFTAVIQPDSADKILVRNAYATPTVGSIQLHVDEVRLHPVEASMTSYTYYPLHGMSSKNNASNYIIYYEVDEFGHPHITRDMRKNIIEKIETKYQDSDTDPGNGNGNTGGGGNG